MTWKHGNGQAYLTKAGRDSHPVLVVFSKSLYETLPVKQKGDDYLGGTLAFCFAMLTTPATMCYDEHKEIYAFRAGKRETAITCNPKPQHTT